MYTLREESERRNANAKSTSSLRFPFFSFFLPLFFSSSALLLCFSLLSFLPFSLTPSPPFLLPRLILCTSTSTVLTAQLLFVHFHPTSHFPKWPLLKNCPLLPPLTLHESRQLPNYFLLFTATTLTVTLTLTQPYNNHLTTLACAAALRGSTHNPVRHGDMALRS